MKKITIKLQSLLALGMFFKMYFFFIILLILHFLSCITYNNNLNNEERNSYLYSKIFNLKARIFYTNRNQWSFLCF